ncbi:MULTISPECIES: DNA polymerase IV [unclassified Rhodococcus (in: high G+C Gram-positive bacteria)]|uniref:DNA polymerase IV n=1 Tax=unclassified Rhodococcus (in: high G+C Gram-positive bacteria) TaxID=192944 RepID=UPI000BCCADE8|nr:MULTISPECIES: DNA polymerase IV [unclassified Rhodococcus (in: high G+C Gram-positive bacteria)]MBP1159211.1 DNA polymerase-4 [Rhodococcus sp. PvR099]PTR41859.1 DNA polymerase-4 [Rhodococcus sp. OK611]SNX91694.1 DNA polymerase-4 [Rhodococcus sp. OK270]
MTGPTTSRRWVLHLDMDAFFASVEQLTRPTLRGRPVLVGGLGGRGVVAGASYEARAYGARSAMPMHQARRMVGAGAVVLPPRGGLYSMLSKTVFDALRTRMPVLEMISMDEAFGEPQELAGADAVAVRVFAEELRALIRDRTGLVASIGAGSGKQIAKIASGLAKPDGVRVVTPAEQRGLFEALPVRKLWGIGPVADEKLRRLGIETIGGLAATSSTEIVSVLGATLGPSLHRLAQGIDDRPVAERADAKQVSAETTFAADLVTLDQLRAAVERTGAAAHSRLLGDGRAARTVVLKLKKSDMSIVTRSATLPYATADLQTLVATAQRQVIDPLELGPVRLVGVSLGGLTSVRQGSLFPDLDQGDVMLVTEERRPEADAPPAPVVADAVRWRPGQDVAHSEFGHGWVQGCGHGVVTVRFETRSTGPGLARTFAEDDGGLGRADPEASLH